MSQRSCPKCNENNPLGQRYCKFCGANLAGAENKPHCEKCGENPGNLYEFEYGKRVSSSVKIGVRTTQYQKVKQPASVYLCSQCIEKYKRKKILLNIILPLGISTFSCLLGAIIQASDVETAGIIGTIAFIAGIIGLQQLWKVIKWSRYEVGSRLAANLKKDELVKQGVDTFWYKK